MRKSTRDHKVHKQKHNPLMVKGFFATYGIPEPEFEYQFHPTRKWRFDLCWPLPPTVLGRTAGPLYLEVQGGIWIKGGHNRGAQMKKDWEKYNAATALGWRPIFVEPNDLMTKDTAMIIREALCLGNA
jgi:hypothetical protein